MILLGDKLIQCPANETRRAQTDLGEAVVVADGKFEEPMLQALRETDTICSRNPAFAPTIHGLDDARLKEFILQARTAGLSSQQPLFAGMETRDGDYLEASSRSSEECHAIADKVFAKSWYGACALDYNDNSLEGACAEGPRVDQLPLPASQDVNVNYKDSDIRVITYLRQPANGIMCQIIVGGFDPATGDITPREEFISVADKGWIEERLDGSLQQRLIHPAEGNAAYRYYFGLEPPA